MDLTFITGNPHKVVMLNRWLGLMVKHHAADLDEIQSLDAREVVDHKVRQAYALIGSPVLVEDISLTFTAMGRLPGTLIKWFLGDMSLEDISRLLDSLPHRQAVAAVTYAFYDGTTPHFITQQVKGSIADRPRGDGGHGWDPLFMPDGQTGTPKTYAEMDHDAVEQYSLRKPALAELQAFIESRFPEIKA